jgi:V/A-type H+-transporting ATPase subunit C
MSETNSSYPFAGARIKAMEGSLITKDKLNRIIEAKDFDMAMRVLGEIGYAQPMPSGATFEQMIDKELAAADELLREVSPNDTFIKIMRAQKDYHNLKVLIKLLMQDKSLEEAQLSPGNLAVDTLRRAITENNYYDLPPHMTDAMFFIDKRFAVALDASIIGVAMDRAYAKEVKELYTEMDDELVTKYFNVYFDLSNIIAFMRIRVSGHSKESFEDAHLHGGTIDKRTFSDAFDLADESVMGALAKGDYATVLASAYDEYQKTGRLYMMEKAKDDYLLSILKKHRHDMFSVAPTMCYYVAKQREAAAIRMVMTAKLGGIDGQVVTNRVKELL